jgi:hypothetical protein
MHESKRFDVAARVTTAYQFDKWLRKKNSKTAPTVAFPAFGLASTGVGGGA